MVDKFQMTSITPPPSRRNIMGLMASAAVSTLVTKARALGHSQIDVLPTVRLVVPGHIGSAPDKLGRFVADVMAKKLGEQVIVENMSELDAIRYVANSKSDGKTWLLGNTVCNVLNPLFFGGDVMKASSQLKAVIPVVHFSPDSEDMDYQWSHDFGWTTADLKLHKLGHELELEIGGISGMRFSLSRDKFDMFRGKLSNLIQRPDDRGVYFFSDMGWHAIFAPKGMPEQALSDMFTSIKNWVNEFEDAGLEKVVDLEMWWEIIEDLSCYPCFEYELQNFDTRIGKEMAAFKGLLKMAAI